LNISSFHDVLETIMDRSTSAWVYLPASRDWSLHSQSITLESEEVPPELEDEPDAGVPRVAKDHALVRVLPVATLQDVVFNARQQRPLASLEDLFAAFKFYYERDAFIEF
jgi:hypothetical protein